MRDLPPIDVKFRRWSLWQWFLGAFGRGLEGGDALFDQAIASRAKDAGIEAVVFDRGGFRFHGRIKAVADAAREEGLKL